jgi:hypothetical protein
MAKRKKRSIKEIEQDLQRARNRLKDVQERGNAAISQYDLDMGYDADFYLNKCPMLASHVVWYEKEWNEATKSCIQESLFF